MPKDQPHASRGRPISCAFCRNRKLRCSREAPCSSCVSRGIHCDLENHVRPAIPKPSESELLERIRKLEELVESQRRQENDSLGNKQRPRSEGAHSSPQPIASTPLSQIEHLDKDVALLASIYSAQDLSIKYSGQGPSDQTQPSKIVFRICPIQQVMMGNPYINQNPLSFEPLRCVWLPHHQEARILFEKFIRDIDHVHHIAHTPWLIPVLDRVYCGLHQQGQVTSGDILLVLGVLASATHSWVKLDSEERGLFSTQGEANIQSPMWVKAVEDVLDTSHRTTSISVEGIQGISLATFVLLNIEGLSRRCKFIFNMTFQLCRELGLHLTDHPSNASSAKTIRAEVGRRVWWYLVASDWSVPSKFHNIAQGIYHCHPRHMIVNRPLHINDEDLVDGVQWIEQPLDRPTTSSYALLRIRLAEISRHMVDRTPLVMANTSGVSHEVVMDIDTELQLLLNDVPQFFSMSISELMLTYQLEAGRAATIVHQGYIFRSLFNAQRCTIHFPYFSRGFVDPSYASSREICLMSARQVIQLEVSLAKLGLTATRYKFLALLVSTFMASIIVLMDLCHNKSTARQEQQRSEIVDAIRILEEARHESETAAKFLDSLMQVLRKHKVMPSKLPTEQEMQPDIESMQIIEDSSGNFHNATTSNQLSAGLATRPFLLGPLNFMCNNETSNINMSDEAFGNGEDLSSYFNELAQSFEQGMDVGSLDWNNIFSGLEPPIV